MSTTADRGSRHALAGPLLMIAAMFCFVALDAILKHLVQRYDGFLLSFGRCLSQVLLIAAVVPFAGGPIALKTSHPWLQMGRGFCLGLTSVVMTIASRWMPLTDIYVIAFASPLIASLIATRVLGEPVSGRQWLLIIGGFVGVTIALGPAAPSAGLILLLPLLQATGNGVYHVLTRLCARTDGPVAQLFHNALFATLILALMLPWVWTPMAVRDGAMLLAGGVLVTFGHFLLVKAFTLAPTARVSPMVYSQIIWSTLFGYAVFGDVPTLSTLAGAVVIIACGVALIRSRA